MAEKVYEGLFIFDASRYSRDASGVSGRVDKLIEKHGGTVLASRLWDERRLAYPIKGNRKGAYWLTYFRLDGAKVGALTEECQRDDNILRQLFTVIDPRIVDQLVSHATQSDAASPAEEKSAEASSEPTATA